MAAIIVAGLLIAVLPNGEEEPGTSAPPAGPTRAGGDPSQALPTEESPAEVPTTAPNGVTWELVGPLAAPVSTSAGPKQVTETSAVGFAHTPEGALIAATQILVRSTFTLGRKHWEPTIERQFVPSDDRDRLLAELRALDSSQVDPGAFSQIAGFSYQSYTPDTAVIGLVLRAPSTGAPQYHVLSLTLLWRDGDWRMQAPPGGSWGSVNRRTDDLTGVVAWGPR
ncbi:hypothetical protein ABT336_02410 [Micromonospora sp. NPDC000207]|uniref:hypothetical protein n=1 Tax=Micromonospora sp. NPDC000207 TaxID=3154246 RepID=UPI00332C7430